MNHLYIPATERTIYVPADFSECDQRQYIEMAALILQYQCQAIDYESLRVHGFYKLLDMKRGNPGLDADEVYSGVYRHSQMLDSFFEINEAGQKVIKQYYTHNPIPSFRGRMLNYHGPSDGFENIKVGEYLDGLNHFIDFTDSGETHYLQLLLATFYRPKKSGIGLRKMLNKYNGDVRQAYNPAAVQTRAEHFKKQHIGILYGFYLFFASFQKYLVSAEIIVFGQKIELSVLFEESGTKQKESELPGLGMKSLVYSFAESGVFGAVDDVLQMPVWDLFLRMYDLTKKNKDQLANEPQK